MINEKWEMKNGKPPKVAIVHDWLLGGGAELVVEELHKMYPDAPIYTSYCTNEWRKRLDYKVITGPLQMWPLSKLRKFIPFLRIWWFQSLQLDQFDLVISSSGAEAKGIKVRRSKIEDRSSPPSSTFQLPPSKRPLHVAYIHAPTHYYWSRYDEYLRSPGFGALDPVARLGLKLLVGPLRKWDYKAAQRPDVMIANSTHTQAAIKKYYNRDSNVIHPPIDTERFANSKFQIPNSKRSGFVIAGRQTPYKRVDLAVQACTEINVPLTVIGSGPEHNKLKKMARPSITFTGRAPHDQIPIYFASAEAFIFPGVDDFGIVAVEAMAAGTPVIAYRAGGALDYIKPGQTGEFFAEQTVESLKAALENFKFSDYSPRDIQKFAQDFSNEEFVKKLTIFMNKKI